MKREHWLGCFVLALVCLMYSGTLRAADAERKLITVLNPAVSEKLAVRAPLATRLDTLEGKTIYVVDTNYEGMGRTPVLEEMQAWFARNMPGVKTVFKLKSGGYMSDDPALWKEIAANKGDGVILGVAG